MATFAKSTFNTVSYAAFRPSYPRQLYDYVFKYHGSSPGARWDTAVDLGCGTGQATTELTPFKRVVGVDPSAGMIAGARETLKARSLDGTGQFEFVQSAAEDLSFLPDGSVDLMVAAQACHWFDWKKMWPETARVLRKNGSAAYWIYSEFRFTRYPTLGPLINAYAQGPDTLGPYWQQPGRSLLDGHLRGVPSATDVLPDKFSEFKRVYFSGDHYPDLPSPLPVILRKKMAWADLLPYLRTWSSLHTYHERHPEDLKNPDGDIAQRLVKSLQNEAKAAGATGDEIEIEWPVALILARRA
ncbi:hypothetical protein PLICRDRAFT_115646 [Plicaturopsis crispa FD-325 SS-3]|nr:hypothetical protein PLICRDRAFT_115646 [Plicaturopsis crispa FD-325 SS-3]